MTAISSTAIPRIGPSLILRYALRRIAAILPPSRLKNSVYRASGVSIGSHVFIGDGVRFIDGYSDSIRLDDAVVLSPDATLVSMAYPTEHSPEEVLRFAKTAAVVIEKGAWIGTRVVILPGVRIGSGCVVGAGSVVTKSIPAGEVWAGVPARRLDSAGRGEP